MPVRRRELELSLERPLAVDDAGAGVVRLTARFDPDPSGKAPAVADLRAALADLEREMVDLLGPVARPSGAGRTERGLAELVETYRPRQRELIDLLREEGELSVGEHALLATHLAELAVEMPPVRPATFAAPSSTPPAAERPSAPTAVPAERGLPAARPVPELLRVYQITSLRQAGAVRARRQISFAEYMALKRHFESSEPRAGEDRSGAPS